MCRIDNLLISESLHAFDGQFNDGLGATRVIRVQQP